MKATVLMLKTVPGLGLAGQTITTDDTPELAALHADDQLVVLERQADPVVAAVPVASPVPADTGDEPRLPDAPGPDARAVAVVKAKKR